MVSPSTMSIVGYVCLSGFPTFSLTGFTLHSLFPWIYLLSSILLTRPLNGGQDFFVT